MLANYFRISYRNLRRNLGYALVNIFGLATGIAVCLLIFLVIRFETSFDDFHQNKNRIYRVLTEYHHADSKNVFYGKGVPLGLPNSLKVNMKSVEELAPVCADYNDQLQIASAGSFKKFKEEQGIFFTTPNFLKIFDFPLLAGSSESLKDPNNVLITRGTAEKYFGSWQEAMGKTLKLNNRDLLKVSGILADIPENTDFQIKLLISYGTGFTSRFIQSTNWDNTSSNFSCYLLLSGKENLSAFNSQLKKLAKKMKSPGNQDLQTVQPLNEVHYDTQAGGFSNKTISRELIHALWLIASFILLIACVNFINLSTAQAVNRSKEVGVRKVLGSNRWQIQWQFLTETLLIVLISLCLSILIAWLGLPWLNKLLEISLDISPNNF